jgi:protein ImuB
MRWACILFPQLALDGVLRHRESPDDPLALISGTAHRRIVQALNPAARALGLKPGMSLTAAQALSRSFETAEYDHQAIDRWQTFLAAWAYGFSSQVSLCYPRALVLEVESSLGLFGPWPRFEARLREELSSLGFRHRITLAPNPVAARVLANAHDGLSVEGSTDLHKILGRMPVDRLGLSREASTAFVRMGLRSLKPILELPRNTLARRFPAELLKYLDTLLGNRPIALECYLPPDEFDARIELNFEVESNQALLFPVRRLTSDLAAFLAGRDCGVQRFAVFLEHRNRPDTQLLVGLLSTEREAGALFEWVRGRLEQLEVPAPVLAVRLLARDLPQFLPERRELFDERPQQNLTWDRLRERLRARLGDDAVRTIKACADYRPEAAWQLGEPNGHIGSVLSQRVLRPGWLLKSPIPFTEPDSRILAGPERIETGWWDSQDQCRHYYWIETRNGRRAWVYRPLKDGSSLVLQGWLS